MGNLNNNTTDKDIRFIDRISKWAPFFDKEDTLDTMGDLNDIRTDKDIGFLDRFREQDLFFHNYIFFKKNLSKNNKLVINFYGYGGVGKSRLVQELEKKIKGELKNNYVIRCACKASQSAIQDIFDLKQLLVTKCGFRFHNVDYAEYIYERINGKHPAMPKVKSVLEENAFLKIGLDILEFHPDFALMATTIKSLDELETKLKNEERRKWLLQLEDSVSIDLERKIRDLFIKELNSNLETIEEPLVILFDGYESLTKNKDSIIGINDKERWICGNGGLIDKVHKVLWVIAGRERLKLLDDDEQRWKNSLIICRLLPLHEIHTYEFLRQGNIPEYLYNNIFSLTNGLPQHLILCIKLAQDIKEKDPARELSIEDFKKTTELMVGKFTDHLPPSQIDILLILSCLEYWTDDMIEVLAPKVLGSFPKVSYENIKKLSFINCVDGIYTMDSVVRNVLYAVSLKNGKVFINDMLQNVLEYMKNDTRNKDSHKICCMLKYALEVYKDDDEGNKELKEFYASYIKDLLVEKSKMGLKTEAQMLIGSFYHRVAESNDPELRIIASDIVEILHGRNLDDKQKKDVQIIDPLGKMQKEVFHSIGEFELPGRKELSKYFNDQIVDFIRNMDKYEKMGIHSIPATLLYGKPGCGKTYAVEHLAEFLGLPCFEIGSKSVASPYIHDTSKKIGETFAKAIEAAPSILIIDEMEAYLSARDNSGSGTHHIEEVDEFLRNIPKALDAKVIIFGMTNMINLIDPAILRKGRFDSIIEVGMPSKQEVLAVLRKEMENKPAADDINLEMVAEKLLGRPMSDIAYIIRQAARLAVRNKSEIVKQEHLLEAVNALGKVKKESEHRRIGFKQG